MKKNKNKTKNLNQSSKKKKKHVETMFLTNKAKNYPFYYKSNLTESREIKKKYLFKRNVFCIKALKSGYIKIEALKSIIRLFKLFTKINKVEEEFKYKLFIFPDFVLTHKPKDSRMGKGKGKNYKKITFIKKYQTIFFLKISEFKPYSFLAFTLIKKLIYKLPLKFTISHNF
jgi:ribosomal protein L16/L10AE